MPESIRLNFHHFFLSTIERNTHLSQCSFQACFSVAAFKVTILTVTTLTFLDKKLLVESTGRC